MRSLQSIRSGLAMSLAALCAGALAPSACHTPLVDLPGLRAVDPSAKPEENVLRTTLANGLKVVLVEDHASPVVALNVWVRTGSADERPDEAGMAHVFEHMLFKGTERRAVGEIARTVEAAGGNINAFTSFDMTVYHITMASRDFLTGIDVLADAIQNSTFDPDELAREMEVVVEEIRRGEDSPGRVHAQAIFDLAYERHPYRLPVIGTEGSVRSFSREQMLDFHRRWYVPDNTTFVAVGDFDRAETLAAIERAFENASPGGVGEHTRPPEPPQSAARSVVVRRDFQQTQLGIAWPITAFGDADTAYVDLLSMVLGAGESSRLYRTLKDRLELVHAANASAYTPLDPGLFFVDAVLEPENVEPALAAMAEEVERLRAHGPSEVELERARVNLLSSEVREKETVQGQARKYGYYEALAGGIEAEAAYLERVRSATPEDLARVAREYMRPERANIAVLLPEAARLELTEATLLEAYATRGASSTRPERQELRGGIVRYQLSNGLRVVVKPNHAVPLVSLRLAFSGGLLAETPETQGISSFAAQMFERGTASRSAAQFAAEVEGIAGGVEGFSGRNSFGLTGEFLLDTLDQGLDLFADALLHAVFDPEEIGKLKRERLAALERREDNLSAKAFELFAESLYPGHPYRFTSIGTPQTVEKVDRESLRRYYDAYAQPRNGVLSIVGDVDPDEIVLRIEALLAAWQDRGEVSLPERTLPSAPDGPRERSEEKNKQQVHIVVGFPALTVGDPDLPALDVLTQVLAGQGGRLFLELRDRQSLAYSLSAFSIEGVDPGSFGVYIASAPDKLEASLAGVNAELAKILEGPISDDEVGRAKAYLMGSHAISLQRYSSQAAILALDELYGLGADHHLDFEPSIEGVTQADLSRVARRIIRPEAPVIAIIR